MRANTKVAVMHVGSTVARLGNGARSARSRSSALCAKHHIMLDFATTPLTESGRRSANASIDLG